MYVYWGKNESNIVFLAVLICAPFSTHLSEVNIKDRDVSHADITINGLPRENKGFKLGLGQFIDRSLISAMLVKRECGCKS